MTETALKRLEPTAPVPLGADDILGPHPGPPSVFAEWLAAVDGHVGSIAHRTLSERECDKGRVVREVGNWLVSHHVSRQRLENLKRQRDILARQGYPERASRIRPFPVSDVTRKGNLAEIVLAEYVCASGRVNMPVYRLRFNPNIDQPMKGNDVLAFDLDSQPVRIIVGEAKFRQTPSKEAVVGIVKDLMRSYRNTVPVSLDFVAQAIRAEGKAELADRIDQCYSLCVTGAARIDYVGLLLSDERAAQTVCAHASSEMRRLLIVSLGLPDPASFSTQCWTEVCKGAWHGASEGA